jgi:hypothetical protein
MQMMSSGATVLSRSCGRFFAPLVCALVLLCLAQAPGALGAPASGGGGQTGQPGAGGGVSGASATLEQCFTAATQAERSATFSGEMTAIPGTARMAMRIDVQERMPGEALFHTISAPGLGVWRSSDPGVKIYKYLKQVTNLSSPAFYRAMVRFHWLNARSRLIRRMERLTPRCVQLAPVPTPMPPTQGISSTPSTSLSAGG